MLLVGAGRHCHLQPYLAMLHFLVPPVVTAPGVLGSKETGTVVSLFGLEDISFLFLDHNVRGRQRLLVFSRFYLFKLKKAL